MLKCILNTVDQAAQARWSAGASILAFIPAMAALMSNSIDDMILVSEESGLLALALCLCSFTVFPTRFGGERNRPESTVAIKEELRHRIKRAYERRDSAPNRRKLRWPHNDVLGAIVALLVACCGLIWYPTAMILINGVVVFSCDPQVHIPICKSNWCLRPFFQENGYSYRKKQLIYRYLPALVYQILFANLHTYT